ncbi:MAG: VOC family protein [Cytophagales bacterium]|nr:VOC family protein [Armatimonadota bacterium]
MSLSESASSPKAQIAQVIPVLPAADVAAAAAFYIEKLGFTLRFHWGGSTVTYAGIYRDGHEIHLSHCDNPEIANQTMLRFSLSQGMVDLLFAEFRGRGVPAGAPEVKPWGTREFAIRDPSGVCITFGEAA